MKTKNLLAALTVSVLALSPMSVAAKTQVAHTDEKTFTSIEDAWDAACGGKTVYLDSDWNLDSRLVLDSDETATLELNGYKISRGLSSSKTNGEVFKLCGGSTLNLNGQLKKTDFTFNGYNHNGKTEEEVLTAGGLITGGYSSNGGGAIHMKNGATLNVDGVDICGNNSEQSWGSDGHGGAIYVDGDDNVVSIKDSYIGFNYAEENGGAIYVDDNDTSVYLENTTVGFNTSGQNCGGAVYMRKYRDTLTMVNSSLTNNYADEKGGAVAFGDCAYDTINMTNSSISYNKSADNDGGAIYSECKVFALNMKGGSIDHNSAKGSGGALYADNYQYDISLLEGASINDNTATEDGGAFYFNYTGFFVESEDNSGKVANNKATSGHGGAVYAARSLQASYESARLKGLTLEGNEASQGGAVEINSESVTIRQCTLTSNKAKIASAVYVNNDDAKLVGTTIKGNTTTDASSGAVQTSALNDIQCDTALLNNAGVVIKENYNEGSQSYRNLVLGTSALSNSYITGYFEENTSIGVSVSSRRKIGREVKSVNEGAIFADDSSYTVKLDKNDDGTKTVKVIEANTSAVASADLGDLTNSLQSDEAAESTEESSEATESTEESSEASTSEESSEPVETTNHVVTVKFEDNLGWSDSDQVAYLDGEDAILSAPTLSQKTFKEWQNLPEGAVVNDDNTVNLGKLTEDIEVTCVFQVDGTEDSNLTGSVFGSGNVTTVVIAVVMACIFGVGGFFVGKKSSKKE